MATTKWRFHQDSQAMVVMLNMDGGGGTWGGSGETIELEEEGEGFTDGVGWGRSRWVERD